jgi:hypothetical protein
MLKLIKYLSLLVSLSLCIGLCFRPIPTIDFKFIRQRIYFDPSSVNKYRKHIVYSTGLIGTTILFVGFSKKDELKEDPKDLVLDFAGRKWYVRDFCKAWAITGETGTGKTEGPIKTILYNLFKNQPNWGGMILDIKGNFHLVVEGFVKSYKERSDKILRIRVRPDAIILDLPMDQSSKDCQLFCNKVDKALRDFTENLVLKQEVDAVLLDDETYCFLRNDGDVPIIEITHKFISHTQVKDLLVDGKRLKDHLKSIYKDIASEFTPIHKYNLLSNRSVNNNSYAQALVNCSQVGQKDSGNAAAKYFNDLAQVNLRAAMDILSTVAWLKTRTKAGASIEYSLEDKAFPVSARKNPNKLQFKMKKDLEIWKTIPDYLSLTGLAEIFFDGWLESNVFDFFDRHFLEEGGIFVELINKSPIKKAALKDAIGNLLDLQSKGKNEMGSLKGTIRNTLEPFRDPYLAEIFSVRESTFSFEDVDEGKVIMPTIPQRYKSERTVINTFFKLMNYYHMEDRFETSHLTKNKNILVTIIDEAQGALAEGSNGTADYNKIDKTREAKGALILASQSYTSYDTTMSKEGKEAIFLNSPNQIHMKAADEACAKYISTKLGKKKIMKVSTSTTGSKTTYQRKEEKEEKMDVDELMALKPFDAIVFHSNASQKPFQCVIPPLDEDGKEVDYYKTIRSRKSVGVAI